MKVSMIVFANVDAEVDITGDFGTIIARYYSVTYRFVFNSDPMQRRVIINNGESRRINAEVLDDVPVTVYVEVAILARDRGWI